MGWFARIAASAAFAIAALGSDAALAGPPYVTDDPEPTELGKWENYGFVVGTGFAHALEGETGFDLNYGAARDLQASAVVSLAYDRARGTRVHAGIADTEIGLKYRVLRQQEEGSPVSLSLFPKLMLPTGGRRFGSGRLGFQLPLWAERDFGAWSLFGGGGYQINPGAGNRDFAFEGLALTRELSKALSIGGEVYHQSADSLDARATTGLGLGATWQVAPRWSIIGSGGPLFGHRDATGRYAFYLALAFHD